MIPDKIYFPEDGLPRYIDWDGSPIRTKQVEDSDVCYIRKDALMEWLKERYNSTISNVGCYTGNSVWKEVIEKLESL